MGHVSVVTVALLYGSMLCRLRRLIMQPVPLDGMMLANMNSMTVNNIAALALRAASHTCTGKL